MGGVEYGKGVGGMMMDGELEEGRYLIEELVRGYEEG